MELETMEVAYIFFKILRIWPTDG